jgi:hypothetical protein
LIKIACRMNLGGNTFDMLRVFDLLLQLLDILSQRLGIHPAVFSRDVNESGCTPDQQAPGHA